MPGDAHCASITRLSRGMTTTREMGNDSAKLPDSAKPPKPMFNVPLAPGIVKVSAAEGIDDGSRANLGLRNDRARPLASAVAIGVEQQPRHHRRVKRARQVVSADKVLHARRQQQRLINRPGPEPDLTGERSSENDNEALGTVVDRGCPWPRWPFFSDEHSDRRSSTFSLRTRVGLIRIKRKV